MSLTLLLVGATNHAGFCKQAAAAPYASREASSLQHNLQQTFPALKDPKTVPNMLDVFTHPGRTALSLPGRMMHMLTPQHYLQSGEGDMRLLSRLSTNPFQVSGRPDLNNGPFLDSSAFYMGPKDLTQGWLDAERTHNTWLQKDTPYPARPAANWFRRADGTPQF